MNWFTTLFRRFLRQPKPPVVGCWKPPMPPPLPNWMEVDAAKGQVPPRPVPAPASTREKEELAAGKATLSGTGYSFIGSRIYRTTEHAAQIARVSLDDEAN